VTSPDRCMCEARFLLAEATVEMHGRRGGRRGENGGRSMSLLARCDTFVWAGHLGWLEGLEAAKVITQLVQRQQQSQLMEDVSLPYQKVRRVFGGSRSDS
jgi:hypothetical protein